MRIVQERTYTPCNRRPRKRLDPLVLRAAIATVDHFLALPRTCRNGGVDCVGCRKQVIFPVLSKVWIRLIAYPSLRGGALEIIPPAVPGSPATCKKGRRLPLARLTHPMRPVSCMQEGQATPVAQLAHLVRLVPCMHGRLLTSLSQCTVWFPSILSRPLKRNNRHCCTSVGWGKRMEARQSSCT